MTAYRTVLIALLLAASLPLTVFRCRAADTIQVLAGTEVKLALAQPLSSQTAYRNQNFRLLVTEDVRVRGQVVVPKDTEAVGVVIRAEGTGSFGKPGTLHLRILWLSLNGRRIPLFSSMGKKGKDGDTGAVWLTTFFGPFGSLVRGKKVEIPAGAPLLAYIDQTFEVPATATTVGAATGSTTGAATGGMRVAEPDTTSASTADTATIAAAIETPPPPPATDGKDDVQNPPHD